MAEGREKLKENQADGGVEAEKSRERRRERKRAALCLSSPFE